MGFISDFFNSKKSKCLKKIDIFAPLSGKIINIEDVPDVVFSKRIVGDGIAIQPSGDKIMSPMNGTIGKILDSKHAFSILSEEGVELFVHFGIDTIKLKGEGFKQIATNNQKVKIGDIIISFDLTILQKKARSVLTPVVISNMEKFKKIEKSSGSIIAGETIIMSLYN